jgi:hypothetical protein
VRGLSRKARIAPQQSWCVGRTVMQTPRGEVRSLNNHGHASKQMVEAVSLQHPRCILAARKESESVGNR